MQFWLTLIAVVIAAGFLLNRGWQAVHRLLSLGPACGGGCGCMRSENGQVIRPSHESKATIEPIQLG